MTYTDFVDQPIAEGDEIIYAQTAYGGGAMLVRATIFKIIPLVPHRNNPTHRMREDQAGQRSPTYFRGGQYVDPKKCYVIQIMRDRHRPPSQGGPAPQKYTLPHSNHIFKVPA